MDMRTTWMGLELSGPIVAGASPLSDNVEMVKRLVDAGASAVVTQSLFEEALIRDQDAMMRHTEGVAETFGEALSYFPEPVDYGLGPEAYLRHIEALKAAVDVPVIGSLNGATPGGWVRYARKIADAGADALELNVYYLATDPEESPAQVESRYLEILRGIKSSVSLPVAMKLSPFFSALPHFARRLADEGADGLLLFNRFYQPDIDIEALDTQTTLRLSDPSELLLRIRWIATLFGRVEIDLAATGGVHGATDVIKALMAGANTVQMASALLQGGPAHLAGVLKEVEAWLVEHDYESVEQMIGSMSLERCPSPQDFERTNYRRTLSKWHL